MAAMLKVISDTKEHQNKNMKKELINVIPILADVFEEKLVEFLPKILSILSQRIREDDPQLNSACAEAIGAMVSLSLKGLPTRNLTEKLVGIFNTFLKLLPTSGKYSQIGAVMCITKIAQTSPVQCILRICDDMVQKLIEVMNSNSCKARLQIMEALLNTILAIEENTEKLQQNCEVIIPIVIEGFEDPDWNVRKLSIEMIHTFNDLVPDMLELHKAPVLEALKRLRFDKVLYKLCKNSFQVHCNQIKAVRDATKAALKAIDGGIEGEEEQQQSFQRRLEEYEETATKTSKIK